MKKILCLFLGVFSCLLITGCGNSINNSGDYTTYEYHYYDTHFNHTEDLIVKYDKSGNIVEYEEIVLYDKVTSSNACDSYHYSLEKKEGLSETCTTTDEGTKVSYKATKKYFDNNKDNLVLLDDDMYKKLLKEEDAKELFDDLTKKIKEEVEHSDKYNYVIIAGEKIEC